MSAPVRAPAPAPTPPRERPALAVDGALLLVVLMWASTFVLFKVAWREIDPVAFTGIRFASMVLFSVGLIAVSWTRGRGRLHREDIARLVLSGFLGCFLYQMGFVLGLDRTTATAAAVLIATNPIFSVIFVWLAGRERPNRVAVLGVVLGFLGVAVFLRAWDAVGAAKPGDLLALGAAAAFGGYSVVTPPLMSRYPSGLVMAYGMATGGTLVALVSLPAMLRQDWTAVGGTSWLILLFAAVGPVYVAYGLWTWAIHRRGVSRTVAYAFLTPVLAGALAVATLHEHVRPEQVVGALLVLAGVAVTRFARPKAVPEPRGIMEGAGVAAARPARRPDRRTG